jgi:hypothetical protein
MAALVGALRGTLLRVVAYPMELGDVADPSESGSADLSHPLCEFIDKALSRFGRTATGWQPIRDTLGARTFCRGNSGSGPANLSPGGSQRSTPGSPARR